MNVAARESTANAETRKGNEEVLALSVVIRFFVVGDYESVLTIEPNWWNADEVSKDAHFKRSNETGSYNDWDADLNEGEFRAMHKHFRPEAYKDIWASPGWDSKIRAKMAVIDGALAGALGTIQRMHLTAFEWESGL